MFGISEDIWNRLTAQQRDILSYINAHGSITPMDAFGKLFITKLSTRVSEMKRLGLDFDQNYESRVNAAGKTVRYMRYRMAV